jgi:phenylacetate-CoA ligase
MYTERDLQRLAYNEAISFQACGVTRADRVLLACTMDRCFVAGLAYFLGVRTLGAAAIRNGHGSLAAHLNVIRTLRPSVIVGVPTFLRKLGHHMQDSGQPPSESSVRKLVCIGEPVRDESLHPLKLGRDLQALWNATVHSTYASSECVTSFCECTAQQGGHLHPDLAVVEILDDRGQPVADGMRGEVVLTPLAVEGMPLIRFRTGDESFLMPEPCPCGRRSPRLGPILGRKQQMMKVRGTTLYPEAVYAALDELCAAGEYYLEVRSDDALADLLTIHVAAQPGLDPVRLQDALQARLRVKPAVVVDPEPEVRQHVYAPESRKPVRFLDRRQTP